MALLLTVTGLVVLGAFVTAIMHAMGKCPLWISVILLCIAMLLQIIPK